jgi:hypothetical protein
MSENLNSIIKTFRAIASTKENEWLSSHSYSDLKKLIQTIEQEICSMVSPDEFLNAVNLVTDNKFEREALRKFFACVAKIGCEFKPTSTQCRNCSLKPVTYQKGTLNGYCHSPTASSSISDSGRLSASDRPL